MKQPPFRTDEANLRWIMGRARELVIKQKKRTDGDIAAGIQQDLFFLMECADLVLAIQQLAASRCSEESPPP